MKTYFTFEVKFESGRDEFWDEFEQTRNLAIVTDAVESSLDCSGFYEGLNVKLKKVVMEEMQ